MMQGQRRSLKARDRSTAGVAGRLAKRRGRLLLERLEERNLLTVYNPIGVTLAPSPVEGTAFAGAVVGTFTSSDALGSLSATINWGPTATPTSSVGTINLIGSTFVPNVGTVPQYSVTGGTTFPEETGSSSQPITVTVSDSADSTNGIITSSTTVADAPLTTTGGIASASVTEGARVNFTGAIALMTYTDGNPNSTAAEFSASISWGDGSPASLGTITKSGATYTVSGIHTYPQHTTGTPYTLRVNVSDLGGATATHTTALTVTDAALSGPTAFPFQAAEGQQLSNVTLGTFLDGNPSATAADFTVSINWGDGVTNDPGIATLVGGSASNAKFAVSGSHVYSSAAGSPYAVTVSVTDSGGATTTINTAATVTQTPLSVSVNSINAVAAAPTASQVIATFFDAGGADPVGGYSANVQWGDGTIDGTAGAVSIAPVPGQPGMFAITAPAHTYAKPGLYPITVSVDDSDPTSGSGNGTALVAAASLTAATSTAGPITGAVEGQPLSASTQVASFTSGDPTADGTTFSAVIDWGDGTPSTIGTITQPGGVGTTFLVSGGHTYAHEAPAGYTVTVRVTDAFNNSSVATTAVSTVADAALMNGTSLPVTAAEHVPLYSVPVATFVDTNPGATAADFTASIDWGDSTGSDANAQVVRIGGSASGAIFAVYGSHKFDASGSFSIVVTVNDSGGQSLTITPVSPNATVAQSTLTVAVLPQTAQAGTAIPGGTIIGTFSDVLGADPVGLYSASIDWGDGSPADTAVTITSLGGTSFSVSSILGHTYASSGSYALTLIVSDSPGLGIGGNLVVVNGGTGAALPVLTPSSPIAGVEGTPLPGLVVATFTDSTPGVTTSSFSVTIDWGDGSPASAGVILNGVGAGNFVVQGNHKYAEEGSFVVSVSLADSAGNHVGTSTTATVSDAPLSGASGLALTAAEDVPMDNVLLGSFVDGNRGATAADFSATIDWGDGTASTTGYVTLVGGSASGSLFSVVGSHAYAGSGTFNVTVTVNDSGGSTSTISSQATVRASQVTAQGFPIAATEGLATAAGQVIATFVQGANIAPIGNFAASIDWGDGTPAVAGTIQANGSGYRVLAPSHTYVEQGTFVVHVAISDLASPSGGGIAASVAVVADAPLVPVAVPTLSATERVPLSNVVVGSFNDISSAGAIGDFSSTISWGDGTTSLGAISQTGGPGTAFVVTGSHTYADAYANGTGMLPISVVVKDDGGQGLALANTAAVADVPINVSVILNPSDDHGVSNTDGITNDNTPSFIGASEPGSTIQLYATSPAGTTLVGQGVTGADGRFTVPVNAPLPDGVYTIGVVATDAFSKSVGIAYVPNSLVIDTVGPKIVGLRFDRAKGRVVVTLADDRSGLDQYALIDGANYQFGKYVPGHPTSKSPYSVTSLTATSASLPTDPQTLTISINKGKFLPQGRYLLTIDSAGGAGTLAGNGLRDTAGNALDGEFYGYYGSGNNKPGGDFVVGLDTSHQKVFFTPVPTQNGYASPNHPPGIPASGHKPSVVVLHKNAVKAVHATTVRVVLPAATPHGVHPAAKTAKHRAH